MPGAGDRSADRHRWEELERPNHVRICGPPQRPALRVRGWGRGSTPSGSSNGCRYRDAQASATQTLRSCRYQLRLGPKGPDQRSAAGWIHAGSGSVLRTPDWTMPRPIQVVAPGRRRWCCRSIRPSVALLDRSGRPPRSHADGVRTNRLPFSAGGSGKSLLWATDME